MFKCTDVSIHYEDNTFYRLYKFVKFVQFSFGWLAVCRKSKYPMVCLMIFRKNRKENFIEKTVQASKMLLLIFYCCLCGTSTKMRQIEWSVYPRQPMSSCSYINKSWYHLLLKIWLIKRESWILHVGSLLLRQCLLWT